VTVRGLSVAGLLCLFAACNDGTSATDAGGGCQVATDCSEIDCQCAGGTTVPSYCLCQGGIATNGNCGPGAVCAQSGDCDEVCSDLAGPGGSSGGGTTGGGSGGGTQCQGGLCGKLVCCGSDAGPVQTYCLGGECTCPQC
jgi:hypothetical protein